MLIRGARVFDGERVIDADSVLVKDDRIVEIGSGLGGDDAVDAAGKTLLPGLIDAHTHTPPDLEYADRSLRQALAFGVTTVLCLNTDPGTATSMKVAAADRTNLADLRSANVLATVPGSHPTHMSPDFPVLQGLSDVRPYIEARLADGADYIKIVIEDGSTVGRPMPSMPPELSDAIAAEAHEHGFLVIAHVQTRAAAEQALASGVDGLAHQYADEVQTAEFARAIAQAGAFVVMTLACYYTHEGNRLADDPRLAPYLWPDYREHLRREITLLRHTGPIALASVDVLRSAGVPILAGTDSPVPGSAHGASLHHELELLVRGGLTPIQALASATSLPARHFRLNDRGRIAPGLRADLVLVDGDPTSDIDVTKSIDRIWRGGIELDRQPV